MARQGLMAEHLKAAHEAVVADLHTLEDCSGAGSLRLAQMVHARLTDARAHLTKQFRFEEHNGYMQAARERTPNREHSIEELRLKHRQLEQLLDGMIEQAARVMAAEDALRGQVRTWIGQVRKHEAAENTLIQEVFNLDVGPED